MTFYFFPVSAAQASNRFWSSAITAPALLGFSNSSGTYVAGSMVPIMSNDSYSALTAAHDGLADRPARGDTPPPFGRFTNK